MAEFKLGRIRFVWKNTWATSTVYYKDDVVSFGGKIYICVIGHSSDADFFTDLDIIPSKWNLISDGQTWKGDWAPQERYVYDDIVRYGGRLYICQTVHTSAADSTIGLESDIANWKIFAEGLDWKGAWETSFDYKVNDLVKYGGATYVCITNHISAATLASGLEVDIAKWQVFNQGFEFKTSWGSDTRYKLNDVVKYGGTLWICVTPHTSSLDFATDTANWSKFVEGVQFEDRWSVEGIYQQGDIVRYGGNQYISKRDNTSAKPPESADDWSLFSEGLRFIGDWAEDSSAQNYEPGDVVRVGGYTYRCILEHTSQQPPNATYWSRLNSGFDWRGEWLDDQAYNEGDVVRYGDNSYVCIAAHISEGDDFSSIGGPQGGGNEGSRPDLADSGQYWSILAIGTEESVLTTKGDLVYYSGSAPTRLPIGINGQILQVNRNSLPEWVTLSSTDDVYHVAGHGVDEPAPIYGLTIDRPWASIRYACEQVEHGTKNPNARILLELNRRFIQREIVEWIDWKITNNSSPFTTAFSYDSAKCERDMGKIVDALIWDITHGGNVRTREAALAYVNETEGSPYLTQKVETVASINYGLSVIANVLAQTAPAVNYQALNGDNSTAIVAQYTNDLVEAESTVNAQIVSLTGIITDAITAGVADNIPARLIKSVLIKVATGRYVEVLPIVVPAETCVIGDELRSVNVAARSSANATLTPKGDFKYSYTGLSRMEAVIGDVVSGTLVTPTTGNNEFQDQTWPYAETTQVSTAVKQLARNIRRRIDVGLNTKQEAILPNTYELADANYGYARDLHLLNKEFIQAEIVAFLADPDDGFPDVDYSKTKCKQDIGFIIDAVAYDLSYGGNWQTQLAGLAYFNGASGVLQIASSEKTATLAAYAYLKTLLQTVSRNITVTPTYQSNVTQVGSVGASVGVSTVIGTLLDDMIDIVDNGPSVASITYPDVSAAPAAQLEASNQLVAALPTIQEQTIDFISENFGTFKYSSATCRRDLRNIMTDVAYDVAIGTNYNGVFNGLAYQRPTNVYNLSLQRTETVGAIRYARDQVSISLTSDGSSASGSETARTRSRASFNEIVDILINGTGNANTLTFPFATTVSQTQDRQDALANLIANKEYIKADVVAYVNNNTPPAGYDQAKCARDVGYIVDALCYDIIYGGTMASSRIAESYFGISGAVYPAGQVTETVAAYNHLSSIVQTIVVEGSVSTQSGNLLLQTTLGTPASASEATELGTKMTIVTNALTAGNLNSLPAVVYPDLSGVATEFTASKSNIDSDRESIIVDTIQFINTTYSGFPYDQAKCQRDIAYIVDAARYDWLLGTNYASIISALSYLRLPSNKVVGEQKTATLAANEFARQYILDNNVITDATAIAGVNSTWEWINDTIFGGSREGGNSSVDDQEVYNAIRMLSLNKEFIVQEVVNFVDNYFVDTATATASTDAIVVSDTSWLSVGDQIRLSISATDTLEGFALSGLSDGIDYYVREILSSTAFTVSQTAGGAAENILLDITDTFTVSGVYSYNVDLCARDVRKYIEAIQWDMEWAQSWSRNYTRNISFNLPANYKTHYAARYYVNSVIGSQEEDFYYLRNGTGLRLQTMDGLNGDLGAPNAYGTQRPTAGAYASLDPGWGPDDERVWITARSPYVQNCTTFGNAAVGQKIDGALHNGGNDSIVSNDFTQLISDGIGAWITNNGRAELVSVFTYYSHIGYLAEAGGRIRATNGNNSYGTYGSSAEGVDADEVAVTAIVDNSGQYNATIESVFTDSDRLLAVEFGHAGNDYTEAEFAIFGPGDDEVIVADEFRDDGVQQVRIIETVAGTAGGTGYTYASNTAQAGNTTSITLAATDGSISSAYVGMAIYVTGGAGIGLYGYIDTYNSGSKIATVINDQGVAGWNHVVPGTPFVSPNSSSTYLIEPRIEFAAPATSAAQVAIASGTYYQVEFVKSSGQYIDIASVTDSDGTGATFDIVKNGSKYYVSLNTAGSGYARLDTVTITGNLVGGTTPTNDIVITLTTVNSIDGAVVEFDFEGVGQAGKFLTVGTAVRSSIDGATWTAETVPSSSTWRWITSGLLDDGSTTYKPPAIVLSDNGSNILYSLDNMTTWNTSTLPGGLDTVGRVSTQFGNVSLGVNRVVAISSSDNDIAYSDNGGATWTLASAALPGTGFTAITYGKGLFVAVTDSSDAVAYSADGVTWTAVTLPTTPAGALDIAWGNGRFVIVHANNPTGYYSLDGITWYEMTQVQAYARIAYGQGVFVATGGANRSYYSTDGINWTQQNWGFSISGAGQALGFGNPNRTGQFIVLGDFTTTATVVLKVGAKAKGRASVANEQLFEVRITEPGSAYTSPPAITITDPGNLTDVETSVRIAKGTIANPTFVNRGSGFITSSAEIVAAGSNGSADFFQNGNFIAVRQLTSRPVAGSNIEFASLPGQYFKLVNSISFIGTQDGSYTAFLQISPNMSITDAPADGDPVELRIRFSQVRLTGHDFLDIGTGGFASTNYPNIPLVLPDQTKETSDYGGGRVFFTTTDQDGNFRVGDLFSVEQATGVATLNADAFNIAGLQELSLGEVTLGGNSASVSEFSTDPFFTANSDTVVPTQRAVKAYIESQIGGGGAALNVNSVTAGDIFVNTNQITTVSGSQINIKANVLFSGSVLGIPQAIQYFLR
jgi:hypothetical protein